MRNDKLKMGNKVRRREKIIEGCGLDNCANRGGFLLWILLYVSLLQENNVRDGCVSMVRTKAFASAFISTTTTTTFQNRFYDGASSSLFLLAGRNLNQEMRRCNAINVPKNNLICLNLYDSFTSRGTVSRFPHESMISSSNKPKRTTTTSIYSSSSMISDSTILQSLDDILDRYEISTHGRIIDTPHRNAIVELYSNGQYQIGVIERIIPSENSNESSFKAKMAIIDSTDTTKEQAVSTTVDLGQITTIWRSNIDTSGKEGDEQLEHTAVKEQLETCYKAALKLRESISTDTEEVVLEDIYQSHRGRGRSGTGKNAALTKKEVNKVTNGNAKMNDLLKSLLASPRCISTNQFSSYLFETTNITPMKDKMIYRIVAGMIISEDVKLGGRYKRVPCINIDDSNICNGGYMCVDRAIRLATDSQNLIKRHGKSMTRSDERILKRLEVFAMMGDRWALSNGRDDDIHENGVFTVDVDVRELLVLLEMNVTPVDAQKALVKLGRWTISDDATTRNNTKQNRISHFNQEIMNAAQLAAQASVAPQTDTITDLTHLPSVCIDTKGASFRDDALGIRPRASTGRQVSGSNNQYEILIHIADLSDIYLSSAPQQSDQIDENNDSNQLKNALSVLKETSAYRGASRYDLPGGPLHLLPHSILEALSFSVTKMDLTPNKSKSSTNGNIKSSSPPNRAVTVWVYIEQSTGKILDCGVEQTLISKPVALSFDQATSFLEHQQNDQITQDKQSKKISLLLSYLERWLSKWNEQNMTNNEAARKRNERMVTREQKSQTILRPHENNGIHSRWEKNDDAFRRTRGNQIADAGLSLYGACIVQLCRKSNIPIPKASGAGFSRAGRVGTAPLRRYLDGMVQRQIVSAFCSDNKDVTVMTKDECSEVTMRMNEATANFNDIYSKTGGSNSNGSKNSRSKNIKNSSSNQKRTKLNNQKITSNKGASPDKEANKNEPKNTYSASAKAAFGSNNNKAFEQRQTAALHKLQQVVTRQETQSQSKKFPALATGRQNEVAILGVGCVGTCIDFNGFLKAGQNVAVEVIELDPDRGTLVVRAINLQ